MSSVSIAEVALESISLSALNVGAVYLAAFTYGLNWWGILAVMVIASVLNSALTHMILVRAAESIQTMQKGQKLAMEMRELIAVLIIALVSFTAVLALLIHRFNFPMALGISLTDRKSVV